MFNFKQEIAKMFSKEIVSLTFSPIAYEGSSCSAPLSALGNGVLNTFVSLSFLNEEWGVM